jgi:hypothetical protein
MQFRARISLVVSSWKVRKQWCLCAFVKIVCLFLCGIQSMHQQCIPLMVPSSKVMVYLCVCVCVCVCVCACACETCACVSCVCVFVYYTVCMHGLELLVY